MRFMSTPDLRLSATFVGLMEDVSTRLRSFCDKANELSFSEKRSMCIKTFLWTLEASAVALVMGALTYLGAGTLLFMGSLLAVVNSL